MRAGSEQKQGPRACAHRALNRDRGMDERRLPESVGLNVAAVVVILVVGDVPAGLRR
jgi:hypothetical protein